MTDWRLLPAAREHAIRVPVDVEVWCDSCGFPLGGARVEMSHYGKLQLHIPACDICSNTDAILNKVEEIISTKGE